MDTTFQLSYPLNSENASPPLTFTVYLSWAAMALPPKALTSAVTIAIVRMSLLFITGSSFVTCGGLAFFPAGLSITNAIRSDIAFRGHAWRRTHPTQQRHAAPM